MHVKLDQNGRIESTTEYKEFAEPDSIEFSFPEGFDFSKQADYRIDGEKLIYDPIPLSEAEVEAVKTVNMKTQMENAIVLMVQSSAKTFTDKQALSVSRLFEEWAPGKTYDKGYIIQCGNDIYRIGQNHTSQEQWKPGDEGTTALYSLIKMDKGGYEEWKAWDGVSGIYALDQVVMDPEDERLYKSKAANNVWGPPNSVPEFWELYK